MKYIFVVLVSIVNFCPGCHNHARMRARGGFALGLFLALLGLSRAANQASSSAAISPNELLSILAYMQ